MGTRWFFLEIQLAAFDIRETKTGRFACCVWLVWKDLQNKIERTCAQLMQLSPTLSSTHISVSFWSSFPGAVLSRILWPRPGTRRVVHHWNGHGYHSGVRYHLVFFSVSIFIPTVTVTVVARRSAIKSSVEKDRNKEKEKRERLKGRYTKENGQFQHQM